MDDAVALFDPISSAAFLKPSAKELGYKVVAVFTKPINLFIEKYSTTKEALFSHCDEVIVSDEKGSILEQLKRSKFSIKAAIAGLDSGLELTDQIAHELHLWGNPIASSAARRDKGAMRQLLKKKGFSCPDFSLCTPEKKVIAFAATHPFPLVIKTPKGAATSQVYITDDKKDLVKKFHEIMDQNDFFGRRAEYAVVEEYISGKEYVVNTFSDGERVHVTDMWTYDKIDSKTFKNIYYNVLSLPLTDPALKPLADQSIQLVEAFGIQRGPAHLELKDDPKRGPTLIEINSRLAGARMPLFLKEHSNFDPYKKTIEVFVHGKTEIPHPITTKKHFAVACCPILENGTIKTIEGIEAIQRLASYEAHVLNVKPGDLFTATTDMSMTPLFVFLAHPDRTHLLQDVEKAHSLFSLTFTSQQKEKK